jgi:hypothetical protein
MHFRENTGLATLGLLQGMLSDNNIKKCDLDFRMVEWADRGFRQRCLNPFFVGGSGARLRANGIVTAMRAI